MELAHIRSRLRAIHAQESRRTIAGSTALVMVATLGSTLLGFGREVVNARFYGTRWEMDTFLAAATIPTILFGLFNGALVSALVPTFSEYLATGRDEEAWKLANTIINTLLVVLTLGAVVGWFLAPVYVPWIAHGFPKPQMGVAIRMTQWLMPSIVATSLAGVTAAILNAHHRFGATALQGIAINIVTVVTVMLLDQKIGIYALVLGTTLGLCAQLLVQLPALLLTGRYRWTVDLAHPGMRKMMTLLGPIVVGSAAGQVALFFDRFFASTLQPGYIAAMNYAVKLVGFPQQIFAAAIATVIFPLLASQFAAANRAGLRRMVTMGLRMVNVITIPATCGLIALAYWIVQTLFERGNFGAEATILTTILLPYAALGLVFLAANVILTRCCFACKETRWPVGISIAAIIANVIMSIIWLPILGARGLLLANSLSQALQTIALLILIWRLVGGLDWRILGSSTLRICVSSVAMVAILIWISSLGVTPAATFSSRAWYLAGALFVGATAFVAVARVLGAEEIGLARRLLVEKFARNVPSAPENREAPIA